MSSFFFDKFYLFFQGVLVFQTVFLVTLYIITRKKDIYFYSIFLLLTTVYFFINAPDTFFNLDDKAIFESKIYIYSNTPLIILGSLFYILFLRSFFSGLYFNGTLNRAYRFIILVIPVLIITSFILTYLGISNQVIFYIINFLTVCLNIYIVKDILYKKIANTGWVATGIFFNIIGTFLTVLMIILERNNVRNLLTVDYPLFFMRCGILADIFFYQIAILKKWHYQEKQLLLHRIEKELAVEKIRNQISSQLHDDIGSTLSGVSMYSHMACEQLEKSEQANAKKSLTVIQRSADEMVEKLGDLVWSVSPKADTVQLFFERLEQYALEMCNVKAIQLELNVPGAVQNMNFPAEQRHHVYLVLKEAINNAVKYSSATLLGLSVKKIDGKLDFAVSDNGKGFDVLMTKRGNGLDNMKRRADEIGATLVLQSKENEGASVSLQCKIT